MIRSRPPNPIEEKGHEDPTKMVIELYECHMHADWNKIDVEGGAHQDPETKAKYLKKGARNRLREQGRQRLGLC